MNEFNESENDADQIYRPSNYYSDCLDMPADYRDDIGQHEEHDAYNDLDDGFFRA